MENDIKTAPGLFLESVQIHAFRGLREVGLADLARVNLLVGKNDSGKTSILEALALFTTRACLVYFGLGGLTLCLQGHPALKLLRDRRLCYATTQDAYLAAIDALR